MKTNAIFFLILLSLGISCEKDVGESTQPDIFIEVSEDIYEIDSVKRIGCFKDDCFSEEEPHRNEDITCNNGYYKVEKYTDFLCDSYDSIFLTGNVLNLYLISDTIGSELDLGCPFSWEIFIKAPQEKELMVRSYHKMKDDITLINEMYTFKE